MTDLLLDLAADVAVWARGHPRPATAIFAVLLVALIVVDANLQWIYRISTKDGEAVRAGITRFDRLAKRMWEYASGKDKSTRKGEQWNRRVRWWTPPIPYRLAKRLGMFTMTGKGRQLGWSRWFVTVELKWGRGRGETYESSVIRAAEPWFNERDNPRTAPRWRPEPSMLPWRCRGRQRAKVAA